MENKTDASSLAAAGHTAAWRFELARTLNAISVVAAVILVISISVEAFSGQVFSEDSVYVQVQLWVCLYFLFNFFVLLIMAPKKTVFFLRHFLLILFSIPYLSLIDYWSLSFSRETLYVLKFLPILRGGVALIVLVKMVMSNKITGLFISYLVIFFSVIYFQTLIFFVFEQGLNPLVKTYYDALWWAAMTVTTLGSNIIPVSVLGKVSTTILAAIGMTTFPIFTVYITSIVQRINQQRKDGAENA